MLKLKSEKQNAMDNPWQVCISFHSSKAHGVREPVLESDCLALTLSLTWCAIPEVSDLVTYFSVAQFTPSYHAFHQSWFFCVFLFDVVILVSTIVLYI